MRARMNGPQGMASSAGQGRGAAVCSHAPALIAQARIVEITIKIGGFFVQAKLDDLSGKQDDAALVKRRAAELRCALGVQSLRRVRLRYQEGGRGVERSGLCLVCRPSCAQCWCLAGTCSLI